MEKTEKILIVDGHGLAFRAFYAVPPLSAPDGTPTNAITGFMNMLARVEEDVAPGCCAVVFDAPGPTFRHESFPQYKEQRKPTPEEFRPQVPLLRELLERMGYPVLSVEGVEADDVIASLAGAAVAAGRRAVILSSDKDLQQVLGEGVTMMRPMKGITTLAEYDATAFERDHGFLPESVPDYLALLGDAADNVPGVPGVGEKTALQLVGEWRTLERLFESLDAVKPAVRKKLEAGRDSAFRSRELIRLKRDVPVDLDVCLAARPSPEEALSLCARLGLSKLASRLKSRESGPRQEAPSLREGRLVSVEELSGAAEIGLVLRGSGEQGEDAVRFQVAAPDGRFAECGLSGLRPLLSGGVRAVFLDDFKALLTRFGTPLFEGVRVWDLKTAHYLLHPDVASHGAAALLPGETPPALGLLDLARALDGEIDRHEGLRTVMEEIDLPLIPVLVSMERAGVRLDSDRFESLRLELEARIRAIEGEVADRAGGGRQPELPQAGRRASVRAPGASQRGQDQGQDGVLHERVRPGGAGGPAERRGPAAPSGAPRALQDAQRVRGAPAKGGRGGRRRRPHDLRAGLHRDGAAQQPGPEPAEPAGLRALGGAHQGGADPRRGG